MKPRRAIATLTAVLAAAVFVPAGPARADDSCQNGKVCAWSQPSFSGSKQVEGPINLECIGITLSGGARSATNNSTRTIIFFTGGNCAISGSATAVLLPDSQSGSFAASGSFFVTAG
jgi:hypothetical protein